MEAGKQRTLRPVEILAISSLHVVPFLPQKRC
jgi:hypothetical protein